MRRTVILAAFAAVALLSACERGNTSIPVSGVDLSEHSLVLTVGQEKTLTAIVRPSNATKTQLSWYSSSAGVASVTNGLVRAISEGTATITVKTDDGGYEDHALVTVTGIHVTGVTLSPEGPVSLLKGETLQLKANVEPANATHPEVHWESSAPEIASVSENGLVTARAKGEAIITVKTVDGNFSRDITVQVNIPASELGGDGVFSEQDFGIYQ